MGRKLDAILGRNFKTSKFKAVAKLAVSRISILKNQHQVRYSQARSDTVELLKLGHHERALHRVEYVIKEQNMVDVFVMIEDYCHVLIERVIIIKNNRECPDELKQSISSLIFSSSRCGDFPELQKIREMFSSWFGREFSNRAVELRNNCGVNSKVVNKFSARQPSLENRLKVLKEICSENGITLNLEEYAPEVAEEEKPKQVENIPKTLKSPEKTDKDDKVVEEDINFDETLSESIKQSKKYKDVVAAARDAFKSAAYAAAAARAAIELSRSDSDDQVDDDDGSGSENGSESESKLPIVPSESKGEEENVLKASDIEEDNSDIGNEERAIVPYVEYVEKKSELRSVQSLSFVEKLHAGHTGIDWKPLSMKTTRHEQMV